MPRLSALLLALALTPLGCPSSRPKTTAPCPEGMVLVEGGTPAAFCIHAYEPVVHGILGSAWQGVAGAVPPGDVRFTSTANAIPTVGYSFSQAVALCAKAGWHLATVKEWLAASGSQDQNAVCNVENKTHALSPTGSFPECVSASGAYDMTGNAWEWADPQARVSSEAFLQMARANQLDVHESAAGFVQLDRAAFARLDRDVVGFANVGGSLAPDGTYTIPINAFVQWDWRNRPIGYLAYKSGPGGEGNPENDLPVEIIRDPADPARAYLRIAREMDGQPITGKVGGAYYVKPERGVSYTHTPYFTGSILGRCATPPNRG